ncbi:MAG: Type 1 glutamine amidotransferase-like domain-containing protein [Candidatus Nanopelagicaceae bacterium]
MSAFGKVALVGSGEYLPAMQELERDLLAAGKSDRYVQIPTAAGRESASRLDFWREIGKAQAERLGAEQIFLPIYSREDAFRQEFVTQIENAGLIYLSGGDPHYLAATLIDTPVYDAIIRNWQAGTSIAGCSAGAMAMGPDIPHFRRPKAEGELGFGIAKNIRTIPHYNKFFGWVPEFAAQKFLQAPADICVVGIDELTAIVTYDLNNWTVFGENSLHLLKGQNQGIYKAGQIVQIRA